MFYIASLFLIVLAIIAVVALVNWGRSSLDNRVKTLKADLAASRKEVLDSERSLHSAERTLRAIANGSGNPVLEAQIALDNLNSYHEKELS